MKTYKVFMTWEEQADDESDLIDRVEINNISKEKKNWTFNELGANDGTIKCK
jgi:hypothetical protein